MKVTTANSLLYYLVPIKSLVSRIKDIELERFDPNAAKRYKKIFETIVTPETEGLWKQWQKNPEDDSFVERIGKILMSQELDIAGPVTLLATIVLAKLEKNDPLPLVTDQLSRDYAFYNFVLTNLSSVRSYPDSPPPIEDSLILAHAIWKQLLLDKVTFQTIAGNVQKSIESDIVRNQRLVLSANRDELLAIITKIRERESDDVEIKKFYSRSTIEDQYRELNKVFDQIKSDKKTKDAYLKSFQSYVESFSEEETIDLTGPEPPIVLPNEEDNRNVLPPQDVQISQQRTESDIVGKKRTNLDDQEEENEDIESDEEIDSQEKALLEQEELKDFKDESNVLVSVEEARKVERVYIGSEETKFFLSEYAKIGSDEGDAAAFRVGDDIIVYEELVEGLGPQKKAEVFQKYYDSYESLSGFELFLEFCAYLGSVVFEDKQIQESLAANAFIDSPQVFYNKENKREVFDLLSKYWKRFLTKEKLQSLCSDLQEFNNQYVLLVQFKQVYDVLNRNLQESQRELLEKRASDLDAAYLGSLVLAKLAFAALNSSVIDRQKRETRKQKGKDVIVSDIVDLYPKGTLEDKFTLDNLFGSFQRYSKQFGSTLLTSEVQAVFEKAYGLTRKQLEDDPLNREYQDIVLKRRTDQVREAEFNIEEFITSLIQRSSSVGSQYALRIGLARKEKLDKVPIGLLTFGDKKFLDLFWSKVNFVNDQVNLDALLNVFPETEKDLQEFSVRLEEIRKDTDWNEKEDQQKYGSIDLAYFIPKGWKQKFDQQVLEFNSLQAEFKKDKKNRQVEFSDEEEKEAPLSSQLQDQLRKERNEYILDQIMSLALEEENNYATDRYRETQTQRKIDNLIKRDIYNLKNYFKGEEYKKIKIKLEKAYDPQDPNGYKPFQFLLQQDFFNPFFSDPNDSIMFTSFVRKVKLLIGEEVFRLQFIADKAKKKAERETLNSSRFLNECSTDAEELAKRNYLRDLRTYYSEKIREPSDNKLFTYNAQNKFKLLHTQPKPVNPCPELEKPAPTSQQEVAQERRTPERIEEEPIREEPEPEEEQPLELRKRKDRSRSPSRSPVRQPTPSPPRREPSPAREPIVDQEDVIPASPIVEPERIEDDDELFIRSSPEREVAIYINPLQREFQAQEGRILNLIDILTRDSEQLKSLADPLQSQPLKSIASRASTSAEVLTEYLESIRKAFDQQNQQ